ncbi:MAG: hypothetical protein ACTSUE_21955, partial [Promethearchaeota archaeon]
KLNYIDDTATAYDVIFNACDDLLGYHGMLTMNMCDMENLFDRETYPSIITAFLDCLRETLYFQRCN